MSPNYSDHLFIIISIAIAFGMFAHDSYLTHITDVSNKRLASQLSFSNVSEIAARGRHTHSESGTVSPLGEDIFMQFGLEKA